MIALSAEGAKMGPAAAAMAAAAKASKPATPVKPKPVDSAKSATAAADANAEVTEVTEVTEAKPAKEKVAKPPKPPKEKAAPKRGIGTAAKDALLASLTNEEALALVREEFPDANTTKASMNWYRNHLRTKEALCNSGDFKGMKVPNARDMAKKNKVEEVPAAAAMDESDEESEVDADADPMA